MRRLKAALALMMALGGLAFSAEIRDTLDKAYEDFLKGRLEDAASGYRYLSVLGAGTSQSDLNLAVIERDLGKQDAALPLWIKASVIESADGFIWNQRAWASMALDKTKESREAFLKAIERSSSTATQAEANLGLGMLAMLDAHPKAAMAPLREAHIQSPYVISAVDYETALSAAAVGDKQAALAYLRQSINVDPSNLEAIKELARTYQKIGENISAWRAYHMALSMDPGDEQAAKNFQKVAQYINEKPDDMRSVRRLSRPMLDPTGKDSPNPSKSTTTIRVALFSNLEGVAQTARRLYFVSNSPFRVISALTGEVVKEDGKAYDQWEILFRPENNIVEVRDTAHNIQYTSKQAFRIVPVNRRGSVLVKSAEFPETFGFNPGDRELRGALEVAPTPYGFKLVNEVYLEDYLYGVVSAALPQQSPLEAYKAQAVFSRTKALWHKSQWAQNMERSDICDSDRCQRYLGLNEEMVAATTAVGATEGMVLKYKGQYPKLSEHANCGGLTEDASASPEPGLEYLVPVHDGSIAMTIPGSPLALERWTHEYPPRDRYCEAGGLGSAADSRWIRILSTEDLRARADRTKPIGNILHLRAARRSPTGRIRALEVVGTRETLLLEGDKAIGDFLSPNSLRSTLFTIQPLERAGKTTHFILWGAGTGNGLGLCAAGTVGQASLGRNWAAILAHYFPALKIVDEYAQPKSSARAASKLGAIRHKNPRKKKTK